MTTSNVKIDIGQGIVITSSITMEAAKDLKLKKGDEAYAIIKASEIIVGKQRRSTSNFHKTLNTLGCKPRGSKFVDGKSTPVPVIPVQTGIQAL